MRAVITFHSIDESDDILSCTPQTLRRILTFLEGKNIPVVDLNSLIENQDQTGVALTFDDGMQSVYSEALPVLREFNAIAHVFLTTGLMDQQTTWPDEGQGVGSYQMLTWQQVDKLLQHNIIFESHTHTHPDLQLISRDKLQVECETADKLIYERTGRRPEFFAYPFGRHNSQSRDYIKHRYQAAFTTELDYLKNSSDRSTFPRIDSFYLANQCVLANLDNYLAKAYLTLRSTMRAARGTQTMPNAK